MALFPNRFDIRFGFFEPRPRRLEGDLSRRAFLRANHDGKIAVEDVALHALEILEVRLVAVVGGSSKGLGAAGIDKDQEIERVTGLFQAAKQKGMKLLIMHIGGEGRRGTLSDAFIEAAAPHADRLIVVDGGNNDKIFDRLVEGKNVKILTAPNVNGTAEPLKATLSEWGVSAQ